jgi:hypothetical protein
VSFGPLSINPLQLINLFQPFFRRRYRYELIGTVSASGSNIACAVHLDRAPKKPSLPHSSWQSVGSGSDPKAQAIRAVAMQILVDLDPEAGAITGNWHSLNSLREGLEAMQNQGRDQETRRAVWQQARACFQDSVLTDPGNWLARFNLGTVLRKLGLNAMAAEQFRELLRSGRLPPAQKDAVKYNLASALQKTDDDRLDHEALGLLDEILCSHNGQTSRRKRP